MGDTFQYFKDLTQTEIIEKLLLYKAQAQTLLSNIQTQEDKYNEEMATKIFEFSTMKKMTEQSGAAHKQLLQARARLQLEQLYTQGYKLLNEIGHAFNGDWQYSITISYYGEMITFHLTEEQFLQTGEWHLGSFRLIDTKSTLLETMRKMQIEGKKWDNKDDIYNQQMYENYRNSINYAKGIVNQAKDNISVEIAQYNTGQILEGYFGFLEKHDRMQNRFNVLQSIAERVALAQQEALHGYRYGKLSSDLQRLANDLKAQTNSRGFWSGGDTEKEGQIKGEGASIFDFSTIRNQLQKFINITDKLNFTQLEVALNKAKPSVKRALEKKIKESLDEVMAQFNATVISQSSSNKLSDDIGSIQSDIDNIVNNLV